MATTVSLFLIGILLHSALTADWTYSGAKGPANWYKTYPICAQNSQSPINIYEGDVKADAISEQFQFKNYDTDTGLVMTLSNNGHTAKVTLSGSSLPEITGGGLGADFVAAQFHFHWSTNKQAGSEHTISSRGFPSELHVVHYRKSYGNLNNAADKSDGLAVLGFMLEISAAGNSNYNNLVSALASITEKDSTGVILPAATLNSLLPNTFSNFYRYKGSLTTPPCYESVTWTVFKEPIKISENQLDAFLTLKKDDNFSILDNVRPVEPLNSREVQANYNSEINWSYSYGNADVDHWQDFYQACGANSQSPINIPTAIVQPDNGLGNFSFSNFDQTTGITMKLLNNGHTVKMSVSGAKTVSVSDGGLSEQYNVAQFHFHWGSTSMKGSEHQLNNKEFPMEVHIVTFKSSLGSLGAAAALPNGLAVLGFFFEISDTDNPSLTPIISRLLQITEPKTEITMPTISLDSFLPSDRSKFYRYPGSLTTPGCYESVIWSVFDSTISISESQLAQMRMLKSSDKDAQSVFYKMVDNYRPVQSLNSRMIKSNFDVKVNVPPVWNYFGTNNPEEWYKAFPTCGSKVRQSPINIQNRDVTFKDMAPFVFSGFDSTSGVSVKLKNNGHTAVLVYEGGLLQMAGGGLTGTYKVAQFHFHWGSNDRVGSEHAIDGNYFPLELHVVTHKYSSLGEALTKPDGLAVLGFMFKVSKKDNSGLAHMLASFPQIKEPKTETPISSFKLDSILPNDMSQFYRYEGSLTTPGCAESVIWTVFDSAIEISEKQLNNFRSLKSSDLDLYGNNLQLSNNFRPIQPISNRQISSNFYISAAPPTATTSVFTSVVFFVGNLGWFR